MGKKRVLLLSAPLVMLLLAVAPVHADEIPSSLASPRNIKGFFEIDLTAQVATRTVVEETNPGVNFEGDAESTRVLAKVATRPWRPVELYLQAGMANLSISEFNDYRGDYAFAYGGGVSLTVYEYPGPKKFQVITRADTLNFETSDHVLTVIQSQPVFVKETVQWREYTLEGIGVWRSQYWEPYIGARFSWLDSHDTIDNPSVGRLTLEEDSNLGLVAGANLFFDPRENFALNIEAALIDQLSLKIGLKVWY